MNISDRAVGYGNVTVGQLRDLGPPRRKTIIGEPSTNYINKYLLQNAEKPLYRVATSLLLINAEMAKQTRDRTNEKVERIRSFL